MLKTFESKRTIAAVGGLASIAWQIYQLVQSGQDVPASLFIAGATIVGAWIWGDTVRPTVPKNEVPK